ncbi:hypothetical protein GGR73_002672 [Xanthomonas sp. F14]
MKAEAGKQFIGQGFIERGKVGIGSLNRVVPSAKKNDLASMRIAQAGTDWAGN